MIKDNNSSFIDGFSQWENPLSQKSDGVTETEKKLSNLGANTFLELWSYPNLFKKQEYGKELCDLLVVFGQHIIIFSDKECKFGNSGNIQTDWVRWYKKAVLASANQLYGAMSWIKKFPDRIAMDPKGAIDFPLKISITEDTKFHLVAIAHGAEHACKKYFGGGDGGLIVTNEPPLDVRKPGECDPFTVGKTRNNENVFVHIMDGSGYENVLRELDTIKDFTEYLSDKEALFSSNAYVLATSENQILGYYLSQKLAGEEEPLKRAMLKNPNISAFTFDEGNWEELLDAESYRQWKSKIQISYFWDDLLHRTFRFMKMGISYTSAPSLEQQSELFKYIAKNNRIERACLAKGFLDFFLKMPHDYRGTRIIIDPEDNGLCYLLFLLPRFQSVSYEDYRQVRLQMLQDYCAIEKALHPEYKMIVGIAHESSERYGSSEDFIAFPVDDWSEENQKMALETLHEYRTQGWIGDRKYVIAEDVLGENKQTVLD